MFELKSVEELELLSEDELNKYLLSLNDKDRKKIKAKFYLKLANHFSTLGHSYESSGFAISKEQYKELEQQFFKSRIVQPSPLIPNRQQRRAQAALNRKSK